MLKVELNGEKGIVNVQAEGTLPELMADITTMVSCIYDGLNNDEVIKEFRKMFKHLADEELYTKSKEEMHELAENKKKEAFGKAKEEFKDLLKEISESLKEILKDILK